MSRGTGEPGYRDRGPGSSRRGDSDPIARGPETEVPGSPRGSGQDPREPGIEERFTGEGRGQGIRAQEPEKRG